MLWACISTRPTMPSSCALTRRAKCRLWSAVSRCCRLGLGYAEGVTHDYKRHGTTTLFAALDVATGEVLTQCKPRHRHQEFLQFLRHIDANVPADLNAHEAQPGIADALATLSRSHTLALAANASSSIKDVLESMGILQHFLHRQVSGDLGLSKPDIRFFLHILGELGAAPQQTIMVGDRLDNDMYPAQLLGMKTVWVRTGAHAILEPREPGEIPDRTIESPLELVEAVTALSSFR